MERAAVGLQKIVTDALQRAPGEEAPVLAWPLVCGTAVAGKTRALDFAHGVLRVQVPDATWRAQLLGLAPQYVGALNQFAPQDVKRIHFVVAGEKEAA